MLQKLNERIQGVVAWIIIVLVAVTFTLFGVDYYMQSHHESVAQAEVNGQPISKQAFELSFRRTRQIRAPSQLSVATENQLKQQVLDEMILNGVSVQSARSHGFEVNASQANQAILSIPQFQADGHFSTNRYAQALNGAFFTPESFQQEVRQGMLLNQQRFALVGTAFALPGELNQFVKLYMQTRDYEYLQIPALQFLKNTSVTDQDVLAYYQQQKNVFLEPEKVSVDYVRLSLQDMKKAIVLSPNDVKRYYEENQSNYLTPAQWEVAHILFPIPPNASLEEQNKIKQTATDAYQELLANPAQFNEKMRVMAADKTKAVTTGVLPWIIAGQSPFDQALAGVTKPGQLVQPFQSTDGYELLKLIAYKPSALKPLEAVQADIHDQLVLERAQTQYTQALEQLSDLSYQAPDSLMPVAKALKLPVEQSDLFSRQGGNGVISKNTRVIHAAFSHDVLKFGNNSEPIQLDADTVLVLRVNKHIPASEKALVDVKLLIAEKLAKKKAAAEAQQFGMNWLKSNQAQSVQNKLAESNHLTWHNVTQAGRDVDSSLNVINELAFNVPRAGEKAGRSLASGDYILVHLKKIEEGKIETLDKEQLASITQQVEANYGLMDYDLYVNGLMSHATIVKY